jgi:hypothetical protein
LYHVSHDFQSALRHKIGARASSKGRGSQHKKRLQQRDCHPPSRWRCTLIHLFASPGIVDEAIIKTNRLWSVDSLKESSWKVKGSEKEVNGRGPLGCNGRRREGFKKGEATRGKQGTGRRCSSMGAPETTTRLLWTSQLSSNVRISYYGATMASSRGAASTLHDVWVSSRAFPVRLDVSKQRPALSGAGSRDGTMGIYAFGAKSSLATRRRGNFFKHVETVLRSS